MSHIIGRGNQEFLLEDDGRLWNMEKTIQYDPKTYLALPMQEFREYDIEPGKIAVAMKTVLQCPSCKKVCRNVQTLKKHYFKAHKKIYNEVTA